MTCHCRRVERGCYLDKVHLSSNELEFVALHSCYICFIQIEKWSNKPIKPSYNSGFKCAGAKNLERKEAGAQRNFAYNILLQS